MSLSVSFFQPDFSAGHRFAQEDWFGGNVDHGGFAPGIDVCQLFHGRQADERFNPLGLEFVELFGGGVLRLQCLQRRVSNR